VTSAIFFCANLEFTKDYYMPDHPKYKVGYLLVEDFSMMCITTMINPFRSTNRELGYEAFQWDFLTLDNKTITASDGFEAKPTCAIDSTQKFDFFFVCAGLQTNPGSRAKLNAVMQRFSRQSDIFGGLCTASYMLARAGLLKDKDFTIHWENRSAFVEEFPSLLPSTALFVTDGNLWTGSGGLSSMDIALKMINDAFGLRVANAVGNQYQIDRIRRPNIEQRPFFMADYATLPPKLRAAMKLMIENLERPLSISELSDAVGITVRSLERGFKQQIGVSPGKHYRKMRLEKAKQLLWHTNMSILEVSILTGFPSPSYLSRLYRQEFGVLPSDERRRVD
jgi:AraC family transcriptional regulator, glycine betaine-responsive activator